MVHKHRNALVESGIAQRMIQTLNTYHGSCEPSPNLQIETCDFWVVKKEDSDDGTSTHVVIAYPYKGGQATQSFRVEVGMSFGVSGEASLTREQFMLVHYLADNR
jgi:hypothetical protein